MHLTGKGHVDPAQPLNDRSYPHTINTSKKKTFPWLQCIHRPKITLCPQHTKYPLCCGHYYFGHFTEVLFHLLKILNFSCSHPHSHSNTSFRMSLLFLWMCKKLQAFITWSTSWWETPTLPMKYHLPPLHLPKVHAIDHLQPLHTKLKNSSILLKPPTKKFLGQANRAYTESRCSEQGEEP